MKRYSPLLPICTVLCLYIVGCGTAVNDPESLPGAQADEHEAENSSKALPEVVAPEEELGDEEPGSGEVTAFGKQCWAACTVADVGAGSCPSTMGGYGNTTFLGGCKKACRKAQGNAASKLPPGCVIHTCSFSGC